MSLKNGHAPVRQLSQSPGAQRSRLHRERQRRGAIVLPRIVIEPDFASHLVQLGWLHESEARDRGAVEYALVALITRAIQAGITNSGKPLIEIDLEAVKDAWVWAKPGAEPTAENAAKALANVARCSVLVGFGPEEFGNRLMRMVEERAV